MEVEEWQVVKGHEGACDWCEQVRCVHVRWAFAQLGNGSRPLLLSAALHQQPHVCVRASIRAATLTHASSRLSNPGGTQRIYSSSSTTTTTAPRRLVAAVLLAQFLSLCLAVTGISSATLAASGIAIPTSQSVLNYTLLALTFGGARLYKGGPLRRPWWCYALLALVDVEANYLVVKVRAVSCRSLCGTGFAVWGMLQLRGEFAVVSKSSRRLL